MSGFGSGEALQWNSGKWRKHRGRHWRRKFNFRGVSVEKAIPKAKELLHQTVTAAVFGEGWNYASDTERVERARIVGSRPFPGRLGAVGISPKTVGRDPAAELPEEHDTPSHGGENKIESGLSHPLD
jgi:hypothetical protein